MIDFILGIITVAFAFYIAGLLFIGTAKLYYRRQSGRTRNQSQETSEIAKGGMARLSEVEKRTK